MLRRNIPRSSVELWGTRLIKSLISITHKQWLFRNSDVHHVTDGLTSRQQQDLTARIHELLETKKKSLLERHKHLMDADFVKLGSRPTIVRQVRVANMEMAISVAKVALYPRTLPIIAHAVAQEFLPSGEQGSLLHTPSKHTGPTTLKQPRSTTPCHPARSARLSKSPYCSYSHTHRPPSFLLKQQSLLPAHIRQLHDAMNKTLQEVFPTATPTTDLRPYDKMCTHLHRLHTRIKA